MELVIAITDLSITASNIIAISGRAANTEERCLLLAYTTTFTSLSAFSSFCDFTIALGFETSQVRELNQDMRRIIREMINISIGCLIIFIAKPIEEQLG
jgi:hypothetical protein